MTLAWDADPTPDIAGYRLYSGTTSGVYTQISDLGNVTQTLVSNLTTGKTYYFAVTAYTTALTESVPSNEVSYPEVSATPTPTPTPSPGQTPASPTNLKGSVVSSTQINLSWADNSSNETGFKIERSINGSTFAQIGTAGANTTAYASTGLAASTKYYYRVRAYNSGGNSSYSNTVSATTTASSTPTPTPSPTPGGNGQSGNGHGKPTPGPTATPTPTPSATPTPTPTPTPKPKHSPHA